MAKKSFPFNDYRTTSVAKQTPSMRLNVDVVAYQYKEIPHKFLTVNLEGSNVMAGDLTYDADDKKGYYLHQSSVVISVDSDEYVLRKDSPGTTIGSSETTSSSQLALNLTTGTFGDVPTTGVSGGITIGTSYTENLSDFRVLNKSNDSVATHLYRMAATRDGSPYNKPEDLVDTSAKGQWEGDPLFGVPEIAISNMPIISQAIYYSRGEKAPDVTLTVEVEATLMYVEKTFKVFEVQIDTKSVQWRQDFKWALPMSRIVPD